MIFEEPSTRTRVSFEVAMTLLGGHALYLRPGEIHMGMRENLSDTARVLSRMVDCIEARLFKHTTMLELARWATVPVINGLTDMQHPTQTLCDVLTISEHLPPMKTLLDINVTFVGDATNVCNSLMAICTRLGINFTHVAPPQYQLTPAYREIGMKNCQISGGKLLITDNVEEAVANADFIYTDLWWWEDQEQEKEDRVQAFMPYYQVNQSLIDKAPKHVKFMHCLPASRNVEVTDEVIDGSHSIVFDQAENRLHTEIAILVYLVYPLLHRPSQEKLASANKSIRDYLREIFFFNQ